jgi:hypothetical protein
VVASDQTHRVRLSFEEGGVKFRVQTPDLGEAEDERGRSATAHLSHEFCGIH